MNGKKFIAVLACVSMPMMMSAQLFGSLLNGKSSSGIFGITSNLTSRIVKKKVLSNSRVYLYNVECGKFLGTEYPSSEYQFEANGNAKAVGFGADGMKWTINTYLLSDNLYRITSDRNVDLCVGQLLNHDSDWKYAYVGSSTSHVFTFEEVAGTDFYKISVCPSDILYGYGVFTSSDNYAFGTKTYLGWSGEANFKIMLPLISAYDAEPRGTNWYLMSETDYKKYKSTIASAYQARMAAWPLIRSVRRSAMNIDIKNLEKVYSDFKSTAAQIEAATADAKETILASLNNATKDRYVDLSFMMADADCQEKNIASWDVEGTDAFVSDEKSVRTANKMFGGRFYQKKSADVLNPMTISQVIKGLPVGRYTLSADVKAAGKSSVVSGVALFAGNNLAEANAACSTSKSGIGEFTTTTFTIDENSSKVKVGVRVEDTNANWVAFDNFKLRYVGALEQQKSDVPAGTSGKVDPSAPSYYNGYKIEDDILTVTGTWKEDDKATLDYIVRSNSNIKAVDLQNVDEIPAGTVVDVTDFDNKNVLVYVKEDDCITVVENGEEKTANVVKDDYCENLVVEDLVEINIAKPFFANTVKYQRILSNEKSGTICLPIGLKSEAGKIQLYTVSGYVNGKVKLKAISSVPANTPCVFRNLTNDSTISIIDENVEIASTNVILNSEKTADGVFMTGSYTNDILVGSMDTENAAKDCFYFKNDKIVRGTDYFLIPTFRAYIDTRECNTASNVRTRSSFSESFDLTTAIAEADVEDATMAECYSVNGAKTASLKSGINIVKYSDGTVKKIFKK